MSDKNLQEYQAQIERQDATYRAGWQAAIEAAAKACDERADLERTRASQDMDEDSCGRALSREAGSRACAAAIRVLKEQPNA